MDEVYIEKLSAFGRMLRREGLAAAPRDTEDAARLLAGMDLSNRERVKTALKTVYASTREEQLIFDRVFDGFFLSEEAMRAQARDQLEREQQRLEAMLKIKERFGKNAIFRGMNLEEGATARQRNGQIGGHKA